MDDEPLDLTTLPDHQRVAYYAALFAIANADGETTREELTLIFETMDLDGLSEASAAKVRGYVLTPPSLGPSLAALRHADERLRFGLGLGLVEVAVADDDINEMEEPALIDALRELGVEDEQMLEMVDFAIEVKGIRERGIDDDEAAQAFKNATAGLTGVGVPVAALYFSGSVLGLGAAGITSGLAALGGMGGLAAFIGIGSMIPGIGVLAVMGGGLIWGVRKLTDADGKRAKEIHRRERERKAQLVIKNLQETITHVVDRMASLEAKADESAANRKALDDLRARLSSLQKVLRQRKTQLSHG